MRLIAGIIMRSDNKSTFKCCNDSTSFYTKSTI